MTGILHRYIPNRVIDSNGISDGATFAFYYTGTTNLAPIYTTSALSVEYANPFTVAAGAAVPNVWLDPSITYRRIVTPSDGGDADDTDPYSGIDASGFSYLDPATGAVQRAAATKLGEMGPSLLDFGAVGDGTTDDTNAFTAARASGEPNIFIPPGYTFLLDGTLALSTANQHWHGIKGASKIKMADALNSTGITVTGSNVRLSGFKLDCNGPNQTAGGIGIFVNGATDAVIEDVEAYSSHSNIILVSGGSGHRFRRLKLHGGIVAGVQLMVVQSSASQFEISDSWLYDVPDADGLRIAYGTGACTQFQINRCWFIGPNAVTSTRYGAQISRASKFEVNNCFFLAWKIGAGLICSATSAVGCGEFSINNCTSSLNQNGIIVDQYAYEFALNGNICNRNDYDGIDLNGLAAQWSVNGGECNYNGQKGLLVWGARHGLINGVTFLNNNTSGTDPKDGAIEIRKDGSASLLGEAQHILVTNCVARDDQGTKKQNQALRIMDSPDTIKVVNNEFYSNKTQDVLIESGTPTNCFIENSGTTVTNTSSGSVPVRHRTIDGGTKTIASGVITITHRVHAVDTESSAASDDLDTINGGTEQGQQLVLRAANDARTVVCKNGTGNLKLAGSDFSLDNQYDRITLIWDSTNSKWVELHRSDNGA